MSYRADIDTIFSDLIALLKANLTTLNQGLTTTFGATTTATQILDSVPRVKPDGQYPCLFVYSGGKTETVSSISNRARKKVIQTIKIAGVCKLYRQDGNLDNKDARNLAANIDELMRNNSNFSSQVLDCNPVSTIIPEDMDGIYYNAFETSLECELDIRGI
jgi:hypothetical protein